MTGARSSRAGQKSASTGPRTPAGKMRSKGNARRHGLAIPISSDPVLAPAAEALAQQVAGISPSREVLALARKFAEAQMDFIRCCQARYDVYDPGLSDQSFDPDKTGYHLLTSSKHFALVSMNSAELLGKLARYERRALARRDRAMHDLDCQRSVERARRH
jgi:hypothetical protein